MRGVIIIVCLFFSLNAFTQNADKTPLYIIDGQVSVTNVNPGDILSTSILNDTDALKLYGQKGANGAVVITSKQFAISQYQARFSALCPKYKEYLELKHTDSNLSYVVDEVILIGQRKNTVNELLELTPDKIKKITFKKDSHFTTDATVIITTKE